MFWQCLRYVSAYVHEYTKQIRVTFDTELPNKYITLQVILLREKLYVIVVSKHSCNSRYKA